MCKVSIIVPVYNVEKYIEDMLMSVQYQTMTDFEVIVVNDGSTDGSQRIIDSFCREDERFHSFVKANGGVASARNMGIEKASGEYVVFYDPDDIIPHDSLEKMYGAACGGKADIVVGVMAEYSLGERLIYMHSQKLAKQKNIDPLDRHFFGGVVHLQQDVFLGIPAKIQIESGEDVQCRGWRIHLLRPQSCRQDMRMRCDSI